MTGNFKEDINMPNKEVIVEFSDGYCIVLENNEVSIRENGFTKFCIEYGKRTNELLEFVKRLYLDKKAKEQECEELKKEKAEIKKYLGISDKTIIQRLEELQEFKDELKISEYKYKQALDKIEELVKHNNFLVRDPFCGTGYRDLSGQILDIINKAKDN